jgi:hypothetical protein
MLTRRHLLELAGGTLAAMWVPGSFAAQAKTATVTLTIAGMT